MLRKGVRYTMNTFTLAILDLYQPSPRRVGRDCPFVHHTVGFRVDRGTGYDMDSLRCAQYIKIYSQYVDAQNPPP